MFIFIWNLLVGRCISLDIGDLIGKFFVHQITVLHILGKTEVTVTFMKKSGEDFIEGLDIRGITNE